ncbi:MAG: PD-(D/E)XK nuclease family protein [Pyrinomonadaceae bacterium]
MPVSAVEPMWLVRLPDEWPNAAPWMSFSDLQNIEACPRRWSLSAASYPNVWSHRGYPPKIYLATLHGHILHAALELIVKSLSRASCPSVADESFVNVMRGLGGYTSIIEQAAARVLERLNENPRFTPRSRYVLAELKKAAPALRESLQILISKLRLGPGHLSGGVQQPHRSALNEGTYAEIELRVAKMRWHGFVDILTLLESNCEIVDFKTGDPTPEHEDQVRVYSLLWARDSELNPQGRIANCITLSFSRGDVTVKSLNDHELSLLESDLELRSS